MKIIHLQKSDIDKQKWNSCVHFAINGNVYGYTWFLDAITKDWEPLIEEGYGTVWPLIWRKNWWGRREIYQPTLITEGAIYSENLLSPARVRAFFRAVPSTYKKLTVHLSSQANIPGDLGLQIEKLNRQQLALNQPYEGLFDQFSDEFKRQLDRAEENRLQPASNLKPEKVVDFYRQYSAAYKEVDYHAYLRIMYNALHRGWGFANGIEDGRGELLAVCFFIYSHGKIMLLLPVVSPTGRNKGAIELLLSMIMHTHASKPVRLDFNGFGDYGTGSAALPYFRVTRP